MSSNYLEPKCPNCKMSYNTSERIPHLLIHCGHTICSACIQKIINSDILKCPIDNIEYTSKCIADYPKNISLLEIINQSPKKAIESFKKATSKQVLDNCKIHQNRKLELICIDDKCKICTSCAIFGTHKNHNIISIEDFQKDIEIKSEMLIDLFDEIEKANFSPENFYQENIDENLASKHNLIKNKIENFTSKLIEKVKNEEISLLTKINTKFENVFSCIKCYKNKPNELLGKANQWKEGVQEKLNILNEINDLDDECLKLIDLIGNNNENYNEMLNNGNNIMTELENFSNINITEIVNEINCLDIIVDDNILKKEFFEFKNEKEFLNAVDKLSSFFKLEEHFDKALDVSNYISLNESKVLNEIDLVNDSIINNFEEHYIDKNSALIKNKSSNFLYGIDLLPMNDEKKISNKTQSGDFDRQNHNTNGLKNHKIIEKDKELKKAKTEKKIKICVDGKRSKSITNHANTKKVKRKNQTKKN